MPWYYASPEGQPLGPFSQEELLAQRAAGAVSPETFILQHGGPEEPVWRRYQEVFPLSALPPVPDLSASKPPALPAQPPQSILVKTNTWAVLGCSLGILSVLLLPVCCLGLILALPGLIFSVLGYYEIERNHPYETGKGLALTGLITSGLSVLLCVGLIILSFHAPNLTYSFQHNLPLPNSIH